jgi:rod shape-determining protein MreC
MTRERLRDLVPIVLVVLAVTGLVLHSTGQLQPLEGLLIRATTPVQKLLSGTTAQVREWAQTARDLRDLRQRNQELEAENARLLLDNVRLREIQTEAALLRDLLNFALDNPAYEVTGARVIGRVIGRDPNNLQRYIILDVGREAGVAPNMPVTTDRGLVGRIREVGNGWSRVLLIIDATSSVGALTQSTRASGLVEGQPDGSLVMRNIPQSEAVSVGDTVFTSGLGGNFPRQILIGQITSVERKDFELYQTASVEPTVDFDHLEVVLIISGFEPIDDTEETGSGSSQP